jgi:hypothetical protein
MAADITQILSVLSLSCYIMSNAETNPPPEVYW